MSNLSRREFLPLSLALTSGLARASSVLDGKAPDDVHQQLLQLADQQQRRRRSRFAAVRSQEDLRSLQAELRQAFLRVIGDLPRPAEAPPARSFGTIDGGDYIVEKLAYESFPGYHVPALLYRPKAAEAPRPAVLSPCGHSTVGKAEPTYQILHINLARRGYTVLTYDPVGQGERSQFWDPARGRSRFNLSCGEHAVLGNPLYLIGRSLARFRIWDGMRGLDYLASRPDVDPKRLGCVGNSGGGTLTAYIAALDPRVAAAAICCYITTLPRRMANRIQEDPSADPEQDPYCFVSQGIDHAGLLAMIAPRPTLLGTARLDFFPIEGARESFEEARRLFATGGAENHIQRVEANERHGLTPPLRQAVYAWFDRWLMQTGQERPAAEAPIVPRSRSELLVCTAGQANQSLRSRPLLPMALEEFDREQPAPRAALKDLVQPDPDLARPGVEDLTAPRRGRGEGGGGGTLILCVNGNETRDWREETTFLQRLSRSGCAVCVIDPRGTGKSRVPLVARAGEYADPLSGVEENIAYNAFLVGKSLVGMRVTDLLVAVKRLQEKHHPERIVACGRRDAALTVCLAAALEPSITKAAAEDMRLSFRALFSAEGDPINAASILPGLLQRFGDVPEVLAQVAPRQVLLAGGQGETLPALPSVRRVPGRFSAEPALLLDWLGS